MALSDSITAVTQNSIAPKNRVDILLDKWEGTPDGETLLAALHNPDISSAALTRALRRETKVNSVVKDNSVDAWRRKNLTEVNGL